jgi:hypothetical protein
VELVTVPAPAPRDDYYLALERGNILFFPRTPFAFSNDERDVLRSSELSSSRHHKNIAYRPASDKVTGFDSGAVSDPERLRTVLRSYSQRALDFLRAFLPRYMANAVWISPASGRLKKPAAICPPRNATICCTWTVFQPAPPAGI